MSQFLQELDDLALSLPITALARQMADDFARTQLTPTKAESVRLNTLAVWVVNDYCQLMDIPTELESSDSWNPLLRMTSDVADLRLPQVGQLECRPVREQATQCQFPPEVWDLRAGYLVVEIADDLQTAKLLGFLPRVNGEEVSLTQLQPVENLLDHLYELRQIELRQTTLADTDANTENAIDLESLSTSVVNLGRWVDGLFQTGWQAVDALLNPDRMTPALGFRGGGEVTRLEEETEDRTAASIRRAKLIDLAVRLGHQQVVLVIDMQPERPSAANIHLQLYPAGNLPYLPADLELAVLEADDTVFMQAQSRQADNYLQLQFRGQLGEGFKIRVQLGTAQYVESFVI